MTDAQKPEGAKAEVFEVSDEEFQVVDQTSDLSQGDPGLREPDKGNVLPEPAEPTAAPPPLPARSPWKKPLLVKLGLVVLAAGLIGLIGGVIFAVMGKPKQEQVKIPQKPTSTPQVDHPESEIVPIQLEEMVVTKGDSEE